MYSVIFRENSFVSVEIGQKGVFLHQLYLSPWDPVSNALTKRFLSARPFWFHLVVITCYAFNQFKRFEHDEFIYDTKLYYFNTSDFQMLFTYSLHKTRAYLACTSIPGPADDITFYKYLYGSRLWPMDLKYICLPLLPRIMS